MLPQEGERRLPRLSLALGRDRVLEVEDQRVGTALEAFRQLALAVGRNEEKGSHRFGAPGRGSRRAAAAALLTMRIISAASP